MKKIPLCDYDLFDKVTKASGDLKSIKLPKDMKMKAYLEIDDKLYAKINDDDKLAAEIFDDVGKIYKETVPKLVHECKSLNGTCRATSNRNKSKKKELADKLESRITEILNDAADAMGDAGKKQIEKLLKKQGDKTKYNIKTGVNVTMGAIALTVGVIGLAAAPFTGGMSLALSVWGFWKGSKSMWDQISTLRSDIDKTRSGLNANLQELVDAYKHRSKTMTGASETAQSVMQWLLGVSGATIGKCEDGLKTYRAKLNDLDSSVRELSKNLNKNLDDQKGLQTNVNRLDVECKAQGVVSDELKNAKADLEKMEKETKTAIDNIVDLNKKLKQNEGAADDYELVLAQLQAKKPTWAGYAEKVIKYGPDLIISGGANVLAEQQDLVNFGHDVVQALADFGANQGLS